MSSFSSSPLFSSTRSTNTQYIRFSRIQAQKFFTNFYKSSTQVESLQFAHSKFNRFLDSVISINSINYWNQSFSVGYKFANDKYLNITQCIFENCKTAENGGAVSVPFPQDMYPIIHLQESTFKDCAADRGGAIFAGGPQPYLQKCCFTRCLAASAHHAVAIYNTKRSSSVTTRLISFYHCPVNADKGDNVFSLFRDFTIVNGANSSHNTFKGDGVFLGFIGSNTALITFSMFYQNTGDTGFLMFRSRSISIIYVAVQNNTVSTAFTAIQGENNAIFSVVNSDFSRNILTGPNMGRTGRTNFTLSIRTSHIDKISEIGLRNEAPVYNASGAGQIDPYKTSLYYSQICDFKPTSTQEPQKTIPVRNQLIILFVAITVTALILAVGIIFISIRKKVLQEEWLLDQQSHNFT